MHASRFWVVGGEYRDCAFDRIVEGTEEIFGPFGSRHEAEQTWRRRSEEHRNRGLYRLTIASEPMRLEAAAG